MNAFLVELANEPGELARITEAIAEKGIDITGVSGAACGSSGRLAVMTDNDAATREALGSAGWTFEEHEATEVSLRAQPGTLAQAARRLADAGVNVEAVMPIGMDGTNVKVVFVTADGSGARSALQAMTAGSM
ncbi:MAG: hypothetical protein ACJ77N_07845 [Chloroflexota bacterium]